MNKKRSSKPSFPSAPKGQKGYNSDQVDSFLETVKQAFEQTNNTSLAVTSKGLRSKSFDLKRSGYDPRFVDAALDRLEELFYGREKKAYIAQEGQAAWNKYVAALEQDLIARMSRQRSERFNRTNIFAHGYNISQVDAILDQISTVLGRPNIVKTSQVRQVRFHAQRRGYDEAQVDAYLDALTEYLLAIKQ